MRIFTVIDVETSGLDSAKDRICEIACLTFDETGQDLGSFSTLINPQVIMSDEVIKIHGITNEEVVSSPIFRDILPALNAFLTFDPILLIAHNSIFDGSFISQEIARTYDWITPVINYDFPVLCTRRLARNRVPYLRSYSLPHLVTHLDLPKSDHHRAMSDCVHAKNLFLKLGDPGEGCWKNYCDGVIKRFK
jgi:DNA polymerase III epsilon subunit-like protein